MIKFGIHSLSQCTPQNLYGFFGKRRYIALDLYDQLNGTDIEVARFQEQVIGRVATANGSFKKTHSNRFENFDALAFEVLKEQFGEVKALKVHDIAVSDGRTTLPFFERCAVVSPDGLNFTASDYASHFKVVRRNDEANRIVLDSSDALIQIVYNGFVFNVVCPENKFVYPLNHFMKAYFADRFAHALVQAYKTGADNLEVSELILLCRPCRDLEKNDPRFSFRQFDILNECMKGCDVIRAMNILNLSYFDDGKMSEIIKNLQDSLNEAGVLITGSNMEEGTVVNGGVYKKSADGFELIASSGVGSPVHDLLTAA